ncbi:tyrosine-type recombinase/integrase [Roseomonas terrae]|uniref:Tyrosine-type recombinase/integrase n=1 Tax=Neoroseomonas terrae TaxID=424799 RepID=A0ABS5EAP4_9PROT|nr:tyrosine-type recombinase/integrase [Neoroseomonas terrae]
MRWLFSLFEATAKFEGLADNTRRDYRWLAGVLAAHDVNGLQLGTIPAKALKPRHADKIHADLRIARGAAAAHYACRYARRVWNWARRQEHVEANPWAGMELPGVAARKQRWTRAQIDAFAAKAVEMDWPSQALALRLGWRLGLRQADILGLTWTALDQRTLTTGKTGADVPLVADAYPDLKDALAATERGGVQVLICETTKAPWGGDHFRHIFREIAEAAGIPADLQWRDLRATAATELSDAGADVIALSTHTGHETTAMARRYARRTPEQFEAAARLRVEAEEREHLTDKRRNARRNVGKDPS